MEKLHTRNFPMTCVYLEKRSNAPNPLEKFGCHVLYLETKGATSKFNPFLLWKLARFLKDNRIDILHCHRHKATFYGALAAKMAKTPVVFSHVHGLKRSRTLMRRLLNRLLFRMVNKVITVSESVRRDVLLSNAPLAPSQVVAIKNPVDVDKFSNILITKKQAREMLNLPEAAFVYGTVGRLVPTKGQSFLIDAFAKVLEAVPTARLVFVGSGRLEADLKKQATDLGCLDAVTFAGQRNDVPEILRAFDSFVLPSLAEGFPGSLLEAMAASLPCIASAVGGIPEIICDEKMGYLVPSRDSNALFQAMMACYSASERDRRQMGQTGYEMVLQSNSFDVYYSILEKLYEEALCHE